MKQMPRVPGSKLQSRLKSSNTRGQHNRLMRGRCPPELRGCRCSNALTAHGRLPPPLRRPRAQAFRAAGPDRPAVPDQQLPNQDSAAQTGACTTAHHTGRAESTAHDSKTAHKSKTGGQLQRPKVSPPHQQACPKVHTRLTRGWGWLVPVETAGGEETGKGCRCQLASHRHPPAAAAVSELQPRRGQHHVRLAATKARDAETARAAPLGLASAQTGLDAAGERPPACTAQPAHRLALSAAV